MHLPHQFEGEDAIERARQIHGVDWSVSHYDSRNRKLALGAWRSKPSAVALLLVHQPLYVRLGGSFLSCRFTDKPEAVSELTNVLPLFIKQNAARLIIIHDDHSSNCIVGEGLTLYTLDILDLVDEGIMEYNAAKQPNHEFKFTI